MHKQTIKTFIKITDGAVRVLYTEPVLVPRIAGQENEELCSRHKNCRSCMGAGGDHGYKGNTQHR